VAGLDKTGKGVIYGYDAIGSYGPDKALAQGSGGHMIIPYLDSEFVGDNNPREDKKQPKSKEEAVQIVYKAFLAAARGISTPEIVWRFGFLIRMEFRSPRIL
jgi:20S proteasome subunit beta 6